MMRKQMFSLFTVLLAASSPSRPINAQASSAVTVPWFGTIVLSKPDGTISHDTAVLVVEKTSPTVIGSLGRTIDQMTPWIAGSFENGRLTFHLDAAGGLDVILNREDDHLIGTATGQDIKAQINLTPSPGLMPHKQLQQEIASADKQLYEAFGACDVPRYASFLSKDLEFYQDHTGLTGYEENVKALRDRCSEGIRLRRELDQDSLVVNAAPGFGAIQAGTQRFYSKGPEGQEHLDATARFTNIWSKQSGTWKLVRIISYDHR